MDEKFYAAIVNVRLNDAKQLLKDADGLLLAESYKSANNRAFYAIEKSMKALLALEKIDSKTHNGIERQFNLHFIHNGDGTFTKEDYSIVTDASIIRSKSDYDDFYIANKDDAKQTVENAHYIYNKAQKYIVEKFNDYFKEEYKEELKEEEEEQELD